MPPRDAGRRRADAAPTAAAAVGRPRRRAGTEPASRARPAATSATAAVRPAGRAPARSGRGRVLWATGRLAALVLAIACTGGLVYLLTAQALSVQRFTLLGAVATSEQEIAVGSGMLGHNSFTVDPQAVAERLAALPTVREARVWGELPDRLVVRIVERQPLMLWQIGNERFLLDASGAVLAVDPPDERAAGLPIVAVRDVEPPQVGGRVDGAAVAALALLLHSAPENGLPIAALDYSPREGFVLHLEQGRRILFGTGARLAEKLAVSAAVAASATAWTTLNVSDPDRPFFPAR